MSNSITKELIRAKIEASKIYKQVEKETKKRDKER